uniref:Uncharacterized protein n=1 Tax=Bacillus subtilis TaxID=1423 RepID=Q9X3Z6_BACIU|nr:unknown [Bacillus subtilis]
MYIKGYRQENRLSVVNPHFPDGVPLWGRSL